MELAPLTVIVGEELDGAAYGSGAAGPTTTGACYLGRQDATVRVVGESDAVATVAVDGVRGNGVGGRGSAVDTHSVGRVVCYCVDVAYSVVVSAATDEDAYGVGYSIDPVRSGTDVVARDDVVVGTTLDGYTGLVPEMTLRFAEVSPPTALWCASLVIPIPAQLFATAPVPSALVPM